jgi:hypothetical protein
MQTFTTIAAAARSSVETVPSESPQSGEQRQEPAWVESPKSNCGTCASRLKCSKFLALTAALLFGFLTQAAGSQTVLTKAGQVHDLGSEFKPDMHVHLTATVTYYNSSEGILFVQDSSGGVYINTTKPYLIHTGDLVLVDGVAAQSFRAEVANDPEIHVLDHGETFAAPLYSNLGSRSHRFTLI